MPSLLVDELRALLDGQMDGVATQGRHPLHDSPRARGPAVELLRVATRLNATMLVIGTKSHSSVHDFVVGGTVHKIINRSSIPVVLVPIVRRPMAVKPPSSLS